MNVPLGGLRELTWIKTLKFATAKKKKKKNLYIPKIFYYTVGDFLENYSEKNVCFFCSFLSIFPSSFLIIVFLFLQPIFDKISEIANDIENGVFPYGKIWFFTKKI